jgi:hypothetical protein
MKKAFTDAYLSVITFEEKDIITTSSWWNDGEESTEESSTPAETPFVPDDGFNGPDIPLN